MATDIIARGMASKAAQAAREALDELAMVVEGTMNAEMTQFTDLDGNIVTPDQDTVYQDVNTYVYYRWNGSAYYTVSDPRNTVRYTPQTLTDEEKQQARENIGALSEIPEIEIIPYQNETAITDEQIVKLMNGSAIIVNQVWGNKYQYIFCEASSSQLDFEAIIAGTGADTGSNVPVVNNINYSRVVLNLTSKKMSLASNVNLSKAIKDDGSNFFDANVDPTESGTKIVREKNLYPVKATAEEALQIAAGITEASGLCRTGQKTLAAANWSSLKQTISITNATVNDYVHIIGATDANALLIAEYGITYELKAGGIEFTATTLPASDIVLQIAIISGAAL